MNRGQTPKQRRDAAVELQRMRDQAERQEKRLRLAYGLVYAFAIAVALLDLFVWRP